MNKKILYYSLEPPDGQLWIRMPYIELRGRRYYMHPAGSGDKPHPILKADAEQLVATGHWKKCDLSLATDEHLWMRNSMVMIADKDQQEDPEKREAGLGNERTSDYFGPLCGSFFI